MVDLEMIFWFMGLLFELMKLMNWVILLCRSFVIVSIV